MFLLLYVDDMLLAGKNTEDLSRVKTLLKKDFDMKDLGDSRKILGVEICRKRSESLLLINQTNYSDKVLKRFKLTE